MANVEFKKIVKRKCQARTAAPTEKHSSSSEDDTVVVKMDKKANTNPLIQSTQGFGRRQKTVESTAHSDDELASEFSFKSTRTKDKEGPQDMGATREIEIDTETDRDAQAIAERSIEINKELKGKEDDHVYRGVHYYAHYFEKKDTLKGNAASGHNRYGPMRAPTYVRSTVRWDYAPDICKDYKETGYCGFGDSCKFLHDRSDYKHGWQIEREVERGTYKEEDTSRYEIGEEELPGDNQLPFRCLMCRESFKQPVVTKCQHYFCQQCALDHYQRKSKRCFVCGAQTMGIFNPAKAISEKLQAMRAEDEKKRRVAGELADSSDDSDSGQPGEAADERARGNSGRSGGNSGRGGGNSDDESDGSSGSRSSPSPPPQHPPAFEPPKSAQWRSTFSDS